MKKRHKWLDSLEFIHGVTAFLSVPILTCYFFFVWVCRWILGFFGLNWFFSGGGATTLEKWASWAWIIGIFFMAIAGTPSTYTKWNKQTEQDYRLKLQKELNRNGITQ